MCIAVFSGVDCKLNLLCATDLAQDYLVLENVSEASVIL
jgi:hypothetical protein